VALILNIETATDACSVCVAANGAAAGLAEDATPRAHASVLPLLIDQALKQAGTSLPALDAVAVSRGPGSYTGLRIGVAAAKGICFALDKPLVAVHTLQAMATSAAARWKESGGAEAAVYLPLIDARRLEVYSAVFDAGLQYLRETQAEILNAASFEEWRRLGRILFFGSGAEKLKALRPPQGMAAPGVTGQEVFFEGFRASAAGMCPWSEAAFGAGNTENVAYFEPLYLKEFVGRPA
jgi:tRNA threonylcarbamoyladenosine biosynthesis protein TsaB